MITVLVSGFNSFRTNWDNPNNITSVVLFHMYRYGQFKITNKVTESIEYVTIPDNPAISSSFRLVRLIGDYIGHADCKVYDDFEAPLRGFRSYDVSVSFLSGLTISYLDLTGPISNELILYPSSNPIPLISNNRNIKI